MDKTRDARENGLASACASAGLAASTASNRTANCEAISPAWSEALRADWNAENVCALVAAAMEKARSWTCSVVFICTGVVVQVAVE